MYHSDFKSVKEVNFLLGLDRGRKQQAGGNSADPLYHHRLWEYRTNGNGELVCVSKSHLGNIPSQNPGLQPRLLPSSRPAARHSQMSGLSVQTVVIPTGNGVDEGYFCRFDLLSLLLASKVGMHVYSGQRLAIKKPLRLVAAEVSQE